MESIKIIIATAFIFLIGSLLNGCGMEQKAPTHGVATDSSITITSKKPIIRWPQWVKKEVEIVLESTRVDNELTVKVILDNPNKKPILSVESWISFDPLALEGASIDFSKSPFILSAPYENTFDFINGVAMIGRSNPTPIDETKIIVAEITFNVKADHTTMISFYDYQSDISGHTSCNVLRGNAPVNLCKKPNNPALIVESRAK